MKKVSVLLFLLLFRVILGALDRLVLVVITQHNGFHYARSEATLQSWKEQLHSLSTQEEPVLLFSDSLELEGAAWTVVPILPKLANYTEADWFFFVTEDTHVDFAALNESLLHFDPTSQELFLGHALSDTTSVIVHHFAPSGFISYPHIPSGFLLSRPALHRAVQHVEGFNTSFNIDPQFELAVFLKYQFSLSPMDFQDASAYPTAITLTHLPSLCLAPPPFPADGSCATVQSMDVPVCAANSSELSTQDVHFAIKTCSAFHATRLPVVRETWASDVEGSIVYYSDKEDDKYETVDSGVPNTERGHCGKTLAIIDKFYASAVSADGTFTKKWLVIADDDTLLSVPRLLRLLRCYDHTHSILLGEVYGYSAQGPHGYGYVTGGGGMVLSVQAAAVLVRLGQRCPANDYPDDMFLGSMAKHLHWDIVHSPLFHQSQPSTYPAEVVRLQTAVSYHRHSPMDPVQLYETYLQEPPPKPREPLHADSRTEL